MAELLTTITPNASNRSAGDIVTIREDGWPWSELERKLFAVVRVPMSVEEAEATYLKSGIPDEIKQAHANAVATFRELNSAKVKDEKMIEAARALMEATTFNPADYPNKRYKIDVDTLPTEVVQSAIDTKAALTDYQLAIKDAAREKVEAELVKIDGELLPENLELHTAQLLDVYERNVGDFAKDALIKASREGSMEVIQPLLDSIQTPPIVEMASVDLQAITIDKAV